MAPVIAGNDIVSGGVATDILDHVVEVVGDRILLDAVVADGEVEVEGFRIVADGVVDDLPMDATRLGIGIDVNGFGIEAQAVVPDEGMPLSSDEDGDPSWAMAAEDTVALDACVG